MSTGSCLVLFRLRHHKREPARAIQTQQCTCNVLNTRGRNYCKHIQQVYDLVGGNRFCFNVVKYNVLDTKGEDVGGDIPPPTVETFWKCGY